MRGLTIAMTIIIFSLSIGIVNIVETEYFLDTNTTLYGFTAQENMNYSDLPYVADIETFNDSLNAFTQSQEQPGGLGLDTIWAAFIFLINMIKFMTSTIINTTINFPSYMYNLGRSNVTIFPSYIVGYIIALLGIVFMIMIFQLLSNRDMRGGA